MVLSTLEKWPKCFPHLPWLKSLTLDRGLEFIWIDALCIIQDTSDWAMEAGRMASVYGGAFVGFAATAAHNVHQGFLKRPQALYNGGFTARFTSSICGRVRRFFHMDAFEDFMNSGHLSSRAWAFQERLLPCRTIHFGNTGLWWECRCQLRSEYLPDGGLGLFARSSLVARGNPWSWRDIVRNYSAANLTYGSDRLPALSGVAARQHEATGDQYLAGLWSTSLIYHLVWRVEDGQHKPRPEWRAPTWSWASVDGSSFYQTAHIGWSQLDNREAFIDREYVQVLRAKTVPSISDPFGSVDSGEITLACCSLIRGRLLVDEVGGPDDLKTPVPFDSGLGVFPVWVDCWDKVLFEGEGISFLLPVFRGTYGLSEHKDLILGLVIEACGDSKGRFRRIGCLSYPSSRSGEPDDDDFTRFSRALDIIGDSVAAAECAQTLPTREVEGDMRHAITLV